VPTANILNARYRQEAGWHLPMRPADASVFTQTSASTRQHNEGSTSATRRQWRWAAYCNLSLVYTVRF
jgi:hypothetical protein